MPNPLDFMYEHGDVLVHEAASRDCPDILALFLGYKASVDYVDPQGYSPLMRAASQGHVDCMKLLLANGANVHFQNSKGSSALHEATDWDKFDSVEVLLSHGANMYLPTNSGDTSYKIANSTFDRQNLLPLFKEYARRSRDTNTKILHLNSCFDSNLKSFIVRDILKRSNHDYCQVAILIAAITGTTKDGINCLSYLNKLKRFKPESAEYDAISYIYDFCFPKSG
jgi:ankyrin repeat protein